MLPRCRPWALGLLLCSGALVHAEDAMLPMVNAKSGISVVLSGENGRDWAVEQTCHDPLLADVVVHLRPGTRIALAHNEHNVSSHEAAGFQRVLGVHGPDGTPDSGDEGEIRFTVDHDGQAHPYVPADKDLPAWCPRYTGPFALDTLVHDDGKPVLGSVGHNGKPYGASAKSTTERGFYGVADASGNEWHVLTYWDNDAGWLAAQGLKHDKRTEASDGHWIALCAAPLTPLVQVRAPPGEQFYTTPLKTYHVPRIWEQTTYLTGGALVGFANLANTETVRFRVGQGPWQTYTGTPVVARGLFPTSNEPVVVETTSGDSGPVLRRVFVRDPESPAIAEQHGFLFWPDGKALQTARDRLHGVEPFKTSYAGFRADYWQGVPWSRSAARPGWRGGASLCTQALNNALVLAIEGADQAGPSAALAKDRLLIATRPEPVGQEISCDSSSPSTDFLQVLGQTTQAYADAGAAYDLLAAHFRSDQQPGGLTPIEEYLLRDQLAKCAKSLLQFRDIYSATSGAGDTHWAHGWELAVGTIAMAMPTYARPCFGVSGADLRSINDLKGADGSFWNPYPDQGATWWQLVTDPALPTPGYPNAVRPFRAEFLLTDDGWWSGPNDLQTEGDRYFHNALTDLKYGGLQRCNGVVELVEMQGYENPFVTRLMAFDHMRRTRGDGRTTPCVAAYIGRLLSQGAALLAWEPLSLQYHLQPRREFVWALPSFNQLQPHLASSAARVGVTGWLAELAAYFTDPASLDPLTRKALESERKALLNAYVLALCEDPSALPLAVAPVGPPTRPPVIRPLFKHVIRPGQALHKDIQAFSPDGRDLVVEVKNLPAGALYDAARRTVAWTPSPEALGVHLLSVTASNGLVTARPFLIVVNPDPLTLTPPAAPEKVTAVFLAGDRAVRLSWTPVVGARAYLIYRDGICWAAAPGAEAEFLDRELIAPGQNTRYHVSAIDPVGGESSAVEALIRIPPTAGDG